MAQPTTTQPPSAPRGGDGPPTSFSVAPALAPFDVPVQHYLGAHHPHVDTLMVGAVVLRCCCYPADGTTHIASSRRQRRMLLVQRSAADYVPLRWEVPGGACEPASGETVLGAAVRELWEETGLRARRFRRVVAEHEFALLARPPAGGGSGSGSGSGDDDDDLHDGGRRAEKEKAVVAPQQRLWRKVTFEVEVVVGQREEEEEEEEDGDDESTGLDKNGVHDHAITVTLDPAEHQAYLWVSEEEVRRGSCGSIPLEITHPEQRAAILHAFETSK